MHMISGAILVLAAAVVLSAGVLAGGSEMAPVAFIVALLLAVFGLVVFRKGWLAGRPAGASARKNEHEASNSDRAGQA